MQQTSAWTRSSELDFRMFSQHAHFTNPDLVSGQATGFHHLTGEPMTNISWESRFMRKQRKRTNDESCSPKRRKLMGDGREHEFLGSKPSPRWSTESPVRSPLSKTDPVQLQTTSRLEELSVPFSAAHSPTLTTPLEGSSMEVEAAQRRLQEIEERITLEDDSDEEELDVEPAQRRPVLVMSDSLRQGLQRGIGDILPDMVAQSMTHSCMELVVWRPPEDTFTQRVKDSLQRQQRKQQTTNQQTHSPDPSPNPLLSSHVPLGSGEEAMEL
ncbi:hypothetical protein DNTS_023707 [Danionella cerebrum]|uniref:Coiled-coil domain-containing protein 117 n=1 Tax=Danionella cerebrum TaxID=2873325 RepID=A0A553MML5_9TELE|nr:hypothetical protein DNTS_023707 [Danionella translucida]